jgi:hypothetical protein
VPLVSVAREQTASHTLLRDAERSGCTANLSLPGELDECRDLARAEVRQGSGHAEAADITVMTSEAHEKIVVSACVLAVLITYGDRPRRN